jgi:hypothetical protein
MFLSNSVDMMKNLLSEGPLVLTSRPLGKRRELLMFDLNKLEDLNNLNNPTAFSNSN